MVMSGSVENKGKAEENIGVLVVDHTDVIMPRRSREVQRMVREENWDQ